MAIHELFAYIRAKNAGEASNFYAKAFGATEKFRLVEPSGRIGHAELTFGAATLMISDEFPEYDCLAPDPKTKSAMVLHIHVDDCDAVIDAAVRAGARLVRAAEDHFYGERSGTIRDPFGYDWMVGHSIEEVTPAEMQRRYTAMLASTPA
jgi:PhnB protein